MKTCKTDEIPLGVTYMLTLAYNWRDVQPHRAASVAGNSLIIHF